jgi:hypothetical protein
MVPDTNLIPQFSRDEQERQPLNSNGMKDSTVGSDGKVSLGEIIGKNSSV